MGLIHGLALICALIAIVLFVIAAIGFPVLGKIDIISAGLAFLGGTMAAHIGHHHLHHV